jgi:PPK2 family polyphosphate:nucleotide phosphotransferase
MPDKNLAERFLVKPHTKVRLRDWDTAWAGTKPLQNLKGDELRQEARETIRRNLERLSDAQELLWASDRHALLVVLQGMDASGKDGLVKHVMSGLNPQGCQVTSFKQPSEEELEHDFLWRYAKALPPRGRIGIFNRSHYEDVLVVRVHPEWLDKQKLPAKRGHSLWEHRYEDINQFERHLSRNGTVILKFFLHVSKKEQKRRLLNRLENPKKHWKFSPADLAERAFWPDYVEAYQDALSVTSAKHAPWFIIPADHKWVARLLVSDILTRTIEGLHLKFPELTKEQRIALAKAKKLLASG